MGTSDATGERYETVIIGAGQAGLAVGYHLARSGRELVILDEHARVGDCWRERYDSLRLYSPAKYNRLPGMRFPQRALPLPERRRDGRLPGEVRGPLRPARRRRDRVDCVVADGDEYVVSAGGRQSAFASMLVGGAGRDARRIATDIGSRTTSGRKVAVPAGTWAGTRARGPSAGVGKTALLEYAVEAAAGLRVARVAGISSRGSGPARCPRGQTRRFRSGRPRTDVTATRD